MNILGNNIKNKFCLALLSFTLLWSCNDTYDEHYDKDSSIVSNETLMDLLEQDENLTTFVSLLKKTGMDAVLNGDQTYTVWAPTNEALVGLDVNNEKYVTRVVNNHIARFIHGASGTPTGNLLMLSDKLIPFERVGSEYKIDGHLLTKKNQNARNGILHVIEHEIDYIYNLWEYMEFEDTDSISSYLYSFTEFTFNPNASTLIDYNEDGLAVYDSVFNESNKFWNQFGDGIGRLIDEDSTYTMILPTNKAWIDAYERLWPYYVSNDPTDPMALQRENTRYAIVQDLVFSGDIKPENYGVNDTLFSTRHAEFPNPAHMFDGAVRTELSNGIAYKTDNYNYNYWEAWNRPLRFEVEFETFEVPDEGVGTVSQYYDPTLPDSISNQSYLNVVGTTSSSRPYVTIDVPGILSAPYNIYCVFVPDVLTNKSNPRPTKVRFEISQLNRATGNWTLLKSGGGTGAQIVPSENEVSATEITKVLVYENFVFPYANVNETENTLRIKIISHLLASEITRGYVNRMKIDYLLLEPVR